MNYSITRYIFWLLTFHLLWMQELPAQNYTLSNWTVEDGLSSNDIKDILQDEDGFIWIATEHGLNKFDGYAFKKHRYHPADSTTIGANYINSVREDKEGNIWVSLAVGIVSKYDKLSNQFENYYFPDKNTFILDIRYIEQVGMSIATNRGWYTSKVSGLKKIDLLASNNNLPLFVYKVFPSKGDNIYLSTDRGFKKYNLKNKSLSPVFVLSNDGDSLQIETLIDKMYIDSGGLWWLQMRTGSMYQSQNGVYFEKTMSASPYYFTKLNEEDFLFEDSQNTKWFCSKTDGLLRSEAGSDVWKLVETFSQIPAFTFIDKEKNIWIYTRENELFKWNGVDWELIINLGERLHYWEVRNIFVDKENGIWLSSHEKGIWRIYKRKWPITGVYDRSKDKLIEHSVAALYSDHADYMWVGGANNLYRYYFDQQILKPFFSANDKSNPLLELPALCIARAGNGQLWTGTPAGLLIVEEEKAPSYKFIKEVRVDGKPIALNYVRSLLPGPSGGMWVGTTNGLFLFLPKEEKVLYYSSSSGNAQQMRGNDIQCLTALSETEYLVGYTKFGVDRLTYDPKDQTISCQRMTYENRRMEQSNLMTANTFYQSDGEIWLGTFSKGLLKVNPDQMNMSPISEDFPIIPNIKSIQKGSKGKLWVSSIDGIRSVNPDDHTFYRFTKSSGLFSNQFRLNSSLQDEAGNLYFGNSKGLNKIQPAKWNDQDTVATPILTDFKKYDESPVFEIPLNEVKTISLNYQDDYITFNFVSPTYHNPGDVQYAYQLEGFDADWRYCENQRSATYTNLKSGDYLFKVKAGNKGGFLNSEIKQVEIRIAPPYWQTAWFVALMLGLLLLIIGLAYRVQYNIRKKHLKIATEVRKKAADDFHDELGHRLTKIVLFVESLMLQKDKFPSQSAHVLRKIQDNANELYYSTKDFIWAMNPSKDSVMELLILLRDFGDELYTDTPIQFSVEGFDESFKGQVLNMDWKRQLVMIFKEAMNNALKHASATSVVLRIEEQKQQTVISLIDNGEGFVLDREKFGYGLGSMLNRSKKIGGQLEVISSPGRGTEVRFEFPGKSI